MHYFSQTIYLHIYPIRLHHLCTLCFPHEITRCSYSFVQGFMQDKIIANHITHVLVDIWMLTFKCWPEMEYKHTCDTIFIHFQLFQGITNNIYDFGRPCFFCSFIFFPVHPYFYQSIFVFTRPNDGWTGLYIKLCICLSITIYNMIIFSLG